MSKDDEIEAAWNQHCSAQVTAFAQGKNGRKRPSCLNEKLLWRLAGEQNWLCCYCGCEMEVPGESNSKKTVSFEHILPVSRGGGHHIDNIAICCRGCNSSRGNVLYKEHFEVLGI